MDLKKKKYFEKSIEKTIHGEKEKKTSGGNSDPVTSVRKTSVWVI